MGIKQTILSTKARTLASLAGKLASAQIQPLECFTVADWQSDSAKVLHGLCERFGEAVPLVVRSSALNEDSATASLAGHFTSLLNVQGAAALQVAIGVVIDSYGAEFSLQDEVLVQPMLSGVYLSGVAFSHDPATGSPYRVVNYALGADTTAVTGGAGQARTFVAASGTQDVPPDMGKVLALLDELQSLFPGGPLDIEFSIAAPGDTLYLLQVRPLVIQQSLSDAVQHQALLSRLADKVCAAQQPHPFLHGRSTVFGVMPDWNPAEIIGIRPRPLALSLYRDLVTDAIWAYQRNNYGYLNLRSFPLLVNFAGQPYIDVRLSFNSFIPKDVDGGLANRLVCYNLYRWIGGRAASVTGACRRRI